MWKYCIIFCVWFTILLLARGSFVQPGCKNFMLNGNFTNTQGRYYLVCNNGTNIINDEGTLAGNFTGDCTGNIVFLDVSADPYPFEYDHINCQIHYTGANAMWPRRKCNDYFQCLIPNAPQGFGSVNGGCSIQKSCQCGDVERVSNATIITTSETFNGLSDDIVNTTLAMLGKQDNEMIKQLCKESKCNSASLQSVNDSIQANISQLVSYIQTLTAAKMNLRKQIDCTNNALKGTIFNQYEEMCRRNVIIQSTLDDLKIKLNIIGKELQRCSDRSWMRQVLESIW